MNLVTKRWWTPAIVVLFVLPVCAGSAVGAAADDPVRAPGVREEVSIRLLQVPFVVRHPRTGKVVRGLGVEDLRVWVDGEELAGGTRRGLALDEVCGAESGEPAEAARPEERLVLLVADLNWLDARGRWKVAEALEQLAERIESEGAGPWRYRVYAITGTVLPLTAGATADPRELRLAARLLREEPWRGWFPAGRRPSVAKEYRRDPDVRAVAKPTRDEVGKIRSTGPLGKTFPKFGQGNEPEKGSAALIGGLLSAEGGGTMTRNATAAMNVVLEVPSIPGNYYEHVVDGLLGPQPEASLSALRAILLANRDWPGWKGVVFYTAREMHSVDARRQQEDLDAVLDAARGEFALWTVDVPGLTRVVRPGKGAYPAAQLLPVRLLTPLALETGGGVLRNAGDLALAWRRLEERLACHYVLSVPVEDAARVRRVPVRVEVDTRRRRDLWGAEVEMPGRFLLETERARLLRRRTAALLDPVDFAEPRVRVEPGLVPGEAFELRVRVPLADLAWEPWHGPEGGTIARLLVDVVAGSRSRTACTVEGERDGRVVLWVPLPPGDGDRRELVARVRCGEPPGTGGLVLRAAVTDMVAGRTGGALGIALRPPGEKPGPPMLEVATGKDLAWSPGSLVARRDRERGAWRLVTGPVDPGDRLRLTWSACGDRPGELRGVLLRTTGEEDSPPEVVAVFPGKSIRVEDGKPCPVARFVVPEYTLGPGTYLLALLRRDVDPAAWIADPAGVEKGAVRGGVVFEVVSGPGE